MEFLTEHLGEFVDRQFGFANVLAGLIAGLAFAVFLIAAAADRLSDFAFPLADAAGAFVAVAEVRNLDVRHGDADDFASLAAEDFAVGDVLLEILADLTADDLLEALVIAVNGSGHGDVSVVGCDM